MSRIDRKRDKLHLIIEHIERTGSFRISDVGVRAELDSLKELPLSTLRGYLSELARQSRFLRVHGGIELREQPRVIPKWGDLDFSPRLHDPSLQEQRKLISDYVAGKTTGAPDFLPFGTSIFLAPGTTVYQVALDLFELCSSLDITVVTNSMSIVYSAMESGPPGLRLVLTGGDLVRHNLALCGRDTEAAVKAHVPECATVITGASAISETGDLYAYSPSETETLKLAYRLARTIVIVTPNTKLCTSRIATTWFANIHELAPPTEGDRDAASRGSGGSSGPATVYLVTTTIGLDDERRKWLKQLKEKGAQQQGRRVVVVDLPLNNK